MGQAYGYRCSSLRNVSFSPVVFFWLGSWLYHQYNETFGPEAAPDPGGKNIHLLSGVEKTKALIRGLLPIKTIR